MGHPARRLATFADLAALGAEARCEIIGGELVEKAAPTFEHADAQSAVVTELKAPFQFRRGGPGGWWFGTEVDIELAPHDVYRPDVAGWRRDRVPTRPTGRPVIARPDWVCEVLSPTNANRDLVDKFQAYHRAGVGHYWIVDLEHEALTVHRWTSGGYLVVLTAKPTDIVRAEPFGEIEIAVGLFFGRESLAE